MGENRYPMNRYLFQAPSGEFPWIGNGVPNRSEIKRTCTKVRRFHFARVYRLKWKFLRKTTSCLINFAFLHNKLEAVDGEYSYTRLHLFARFVLWIKFIINSIYTSFLELKGNSIIYDKGWSYSEWFNIKGYKARTFCFLRAASRAMEKTERFRVILNWWKPRESGS